MNGLLCATVVIVALIVLCVLGALAFTKECFSDTEKITNSKFFDSLVPQNLKFTKLADKVKGTSIINVTAVETGRFPIQLETTTNWYNTQPMI